MNCPMHIKIYASSPHSYRDLPIRLAEFGTVYRWEQSGELGGMTRVRGFTQDDAHIFCTEEQVFGEIQGCLQLVLKILGTLGLDSYRVRIGLRDADSAKYVGTSEQWERAEAAFAKASKTLGVPFTEERGEAAFYGPKIDFVVKDVIGREWQLGTVQVDYNLPERFGLSLCRVGQFGTPTRDDPSSAVRFTRTFLRRFDRAFCGKLSGLAGAGTGAGPSDLGKASGIRQVHL